MRDTLPPIDWLLLSLRLTLYHAYAFLLDPVCWADTPATTSAAASEGYTYTPFWEDRPITWRGGGRDELMACDDPSSLFRHGWTKLPHFLTVGLVWASSGCLLAWAGRRHQHDDCLASVFVFHFLERHEHRPSCPGPRKGSVNCQHLFAIKWLSEDGAESPEALLPFNVIMGRAQSPYRRPSLVHGNRQPPLRPKSRSGRHLCSLSAPLPPVASQRAAALSVRRPSWPSNVASQPAVIRLPIAWRLTCLSSPLPTRPAPNGDHIRPGSDFFHGRGRVGEDGTVC